MKINPDKKPTDIRPKLPMRDKGKTRQFYLNALGYQKGGRVDYDGISWSKMTRREFSILDPDNNLLTFGQAILN